MKNVTIISTSLNPGSKSQIMATKLAAVLEGKGVQVERVDLRNHALLQAGAPGCWEHPDLEGIKAKIEGASHIVFAVPVYCYDVNSAAKNVIELLGRSFTDKIIGFMCSAGGQGSYMAVMGMANHLMLDFRCVIVPRFFYAAGTDWSEDGVLDPNAEERISTMYDDMRRITVAVE
ncbi:MAG: NAD(P)H-dependent FMN reductase [Candidatus Krumholzibacteriia bacterium]|jgi:NAD(P)H-dependent FMN reductase